MFMLKLYINVCLHIHLYTHIFYLYKNIFYFSYIIVLQDKSCPVSQAEIYFKLHYFNKIRILTSSDYRSTSIKGVLFIQNLYIRYTQKILFAMFSILEEVIINPHSFSTDKLHLLSFFFFFNGKVLIAHSFPSIAPKQFFVT